MSKTKLILALVAATLTTQVEALPLRDNVGTKQMVSRVDNEGMVALREIVAIIETYTPEQKESFGDILSIMSELDSKGRDRLITALWIYFNDPQ